ncbi:Uncharacterised protein [Klebsiella pneumoniae]|nr:Uncharacterised protein [Klebsiella pneumoniae]
MKSILCLFVCIYQKQIDLSLVGHVCCIYMVVVGW